MKKNLSLHRISLGIIVFAASFLLVVSFPGCNLLISFFDTNTAPVCKAGNDIFLETGQEARLDGSDSYDKDGDSLDYLWQLTEKPVESLLDTSAIVNNRMPLAWFRPDVIGSYVITLTVDDGKLTEEDSLHVTMIAGSAPSGDPTTVPTFQATDAPTAEPTIEPSAEPTGEATIEATAAPTMMPTIGPSAEPTGEPTFDSTNKPTSEPTTGSTARPAAAYYFNGDASDTSGNENNGTVYSALLTEDRYMIPDMAYDFRGGAYIDCGNSESLDFNNAISVVMWCNPSDAAFHVILDKMSAAGDAGYAITIQNKIVTFLRHGMPVVKGDITSYGPNSWIFIAFTWEPGFSPPRMYIGNTAPVEVPDPGAWTRSSVSLFIGRAHSGDKYYSGVIDDLVIFDSIIPYSAIAEYYNGTKAERELRK